MEQENTPAKSQDFFQDNKVANRQKIKYAYNNKDKILKLFAKYRLHRDKQRRLLEQKLYIGHLCLGDKKSQPFFIGQKISR